MHYSQQTPHSSHLQREEEGKKNGEGRKQEEEVGRMKGKTEGERSRKEAKRKWTDVNLR
jgi:hypothetical protein